MDAIAIASSALTTHRKWLDAISDNLSNINTVTPTSGAAFQARYVKVTEGAGITGVNVTGVEYGDAEGKLTYDPENPIADKDGYVRMPDIDLASQMGYLVMAQRGYEANAAIVDRAKSTYEAALQIGKG